MIDQLIAALNQEVDLSAEEIADTLWLAMQMENLGSGASSGSGRSQKSKSDSDITKDKSNNPSEQDLSNKSESKTSTQEQKSTEQQQEDKQAGVYNQKPDQSQKSLDIPFKVPDAPSLREQLDLARALRPLMRRIASGSTLVIDEAATVQKIAEEGIWLPVIRPTLEPWLDLELVVDEGISMQIWRHTIKELERLLKNYGIFRNVRVWGLISNEQNKIQIRRGIGATAKNQSPRSAAELIDSSGRCLVLVVSDCVSDIWRSGAVNSALKTWANNVPTAIIQMLSQWLWSRTALGRATEVRFQGLAPSVSNRQLIANAVSLWSEIDEVTGIKVPVFTLEPERVSKWAQMLVGKGSIQSSGFVFKPEIRDLERDKPLFNLDRSELTPKQRVQAFRVTASPMARKLAGLLAAAPVISLPVVRLIQEAMLKNSQQVHVAEVFLGGLLKPLSEIEVDTEPDYVQYGFIDGVRELLFDSVPTSSVLNVVEEVSKFVARKVGLSLSEFAAVLRNPEEISDSEVVEQVQPFAMVTAQILRRLGGEYVKIADAMRFKSSIDAIKNLEKISNEAIEIGKKIANENIDIYDLASDFPRSNLINKSLIISDIISKRTTIAAEPKEKKKQLESLAAKLNQLEVQKQTILQKPRITPNLVERLEQINFLKLIDEIIQEQQLQENLYKRFERNSINIGVIGLARQGKSTFLQSLSGLTYDDIPNSDGQPCTMIQSNILHSEGEAYGVVHFHSEQSFLEEVIKPYYEELGIPNPPQTLTQFRNTTLTRIPKKFEHSAKIDSLYHHLKYDYYLNFDKYANFLNSEKCAKQISNSDIKQYVSQEYDIDGNPRNFKHLAIEKVEIFCPFPKVDLQQIALVDMPGLGDTRLGDAERMINKLSQNVDFIVFIRRPLQMGDFWGAADIYLYETVYKALNEKLPLDKWSFMVLNHAGDNLQRCKDFENTREQKGIRVEKCLIANCRNSIEANNVLEQIIEYLAKNIVLLDRQYMSTSLNGLKSLQSKVEQELRKLDVVKHFW